MGMIKEGEKHLEKLKCLYKILEWDAALLCSWQETEWGAGTGRDSWVRSHGKLSQGKDIVRYLCRQKVEGGKGGGDRRMSSCREKVPLQILQQINLPAHPDRQFNVKSLVVGTTVVPLLPSVLTEILA